MTTLLYRMWSQFFNTYSTIFGVFQNQITVHILPKRELWTHIVVKQQPLALDKTLLISLQNPCESGCPKHHPLCTAV